MPEIPFPPAPFTWFKSSYSGANTTECVEAAHLSDSTAVRDSKNPHGPVLQFGHESWRGFLAGVPTGV